MEEGPFRDIKEERRVKKALYCQDILGLLVEMKEFREQVDRVVAEVKRRGSLENSEKEFLDGNLCRIVKKFKAIDKRFLRWCESVKRERRSIGFLDALETVHDMLKERKAKGDRELLGTTEILQFEDVDGLTLSRDIKEECKMKRRLYEEDILHLSNLADEYIKRERNDNELFHRIIKGFAIASDAFRRYDQRWKNSGNPITEYEQGMFQMLREQKDKVLRGRMGRCIM